jgi:hypothetical protein
MRILGNSNVHLSVKRLAWRHLRVFSRLVIRSDLYFINGGALSKAAAVVTLLKFRLTRRGNRDLEDFRRHLTRTIVERHVQELNPNWRFVEHLIRILGWRPLNIIYHNFCKG